MLIKGVQTSFAKMAVKIDVEEFFKEITPCFRQSRLATSRPHEFQGRI